LLLVVLLASDALQEEDNPLSIDCIEVLLTYLHPRFVASILEPVREQKQVVELNRIKRK